MPNNLLYAGQYLDGESGFYYMRARYYDPTVAQFTSLDPLASMTNANYSYASDDPVNEVDPTGLISAEENGEDDCMYARSMHDHIYFCRV